MDDPRFGTCSWNYDSWVGLVYSKRARSAAEYLGEYSAKYRTVEIDSWFYKVPDRSEVLEYLANVDKDFRFTCKVPEQITLTHHRDFHKPDVLEKNENFMSPGLFNRFLEAIEPMLPRLDAVMLEFEYLSKAKMSGIGEFIDRTGEMIRRYSGAIPIAIEVRNKDYLTPEYFSFLDMAKTMHVYSEKQYMPHIYDVYEKSRPRLATDPILRLLGGDRKRIEAIAKGRWDKIVEPKEDKGRIAEMTRKIQLDGRKVIVNINNHYEGSAPLTIDYFIEALRRES